MIPKSEEYPTRQEISDAFEKGVELDEELQKYLIEELKKHDKARLQSPPQLTAFAVGVVAAQTGLSIDQEVLYQLLGDPEPRIVKEAIQKFLNEQFGNQSSVINAVLQVVRIDSLHVSPNLTGTSLVAEQIAPMLYELYVCYGPIKKGIQKIIFLYDCSIKGKDYITSPYFKEGTKNLDPPVPCVEPIDITQASTVSEVYTLLNENLSSVLSEITWDKTGNDLKFPIRHSIPKGTKDYYWMDIKDNPTPPGNKGGSIRLTNNANEQLILKITDV